MAAMAKSTIKMAINITLKENLGFSALCDDLSYTGLTYATYVNSYYLTPSMRLFTTKY